MTHMYVLLSSDTSRVLHAFSARAHEGRDKVGGVSLGTLRVLLSVPKERMLEKSLLPKRPYAFLCKPLSLNWRGFKVASVFGGLGIRV